MKERRGKKGFRRVMVWLIIFCLGFAPMLTSMGIGMSFASVNIDIDKNHAVERVDAYSHYIKIEKGNADSFSLNDPEVFDFTEDVVYKESSGETKVTFYLNSKEIGTIIVATEKELELELESGSSICDNSDLELQLKDYLPDASFSAQGGEYHAGREISSAYSYTVSADRLKTCDGEIKITLRSKSFHSGASLKEYAAVKEYVYKIKSGPRLNHKWGYEFNIYENDSLLSTGLGYEFNEIVQKQGDDVLDSELAIVVGDFDDETYMINKDEFTDPYSLSEPIFKSGSFIANFKYGDNRYDKDIEFDFMNPSSVRDLVSNNITLDSVDLSWDKPNRDDGLVGYQVFRKDSSTAINAEEDYELLTSELVERLNYPDTGIDHGSEYHYAVRAVYELRNGKRIYSTAQFIVVKTADVKIVVRSTDVNRGQATFELGRNNIESHSGPSTQEQSVYLYLDNRYTIRARANVMKDSEYTFFYWEETVSNNGIITKPTSKMMDSNDSNQYLVTDYSLIVSDENFSKGDVVELDAYFRVAGVTLDLIADEAHMGKIVTSESKVPETELNGVQNPEAGQYKQNTELGVWAEPTPGYELKSLTYVETNEVKKRKDYDLVADDPNQRDLSIMLSKEDGKITGSFVKEIVGHNGLKWTYNDNQGLIATNEISVARDGVSDEQQQDTTVTRLHKPDLSVELPYNSLVSDLVFDLELPKLRASNKVEVQSGFNGDDPIFTELSHNNNTYKIIGANAGHIMKIENGEILPLMPGEKLVTGQEYKFQIRMTHSQNGIDGYSNNATVEIGFIFRVELEEPNFELVIDQEKANEGVDTDGGLFKIYSLNSENEDIQKVLRGFENEDFKSNVPIDQIIGLDFKVNEAKSDHLRYELKKFTVISETLVPIEGQADQFRKILNTTEVDDPEAVHQWQISGNTKVVADVDLISYSLKQEGDKALGSIQATKTTESVSSRTSRLQSSGDGFVSIEGTRFNYDDVISIKAVANANQEFYKWSTPIVVDKSKYGDEIFNPVKNEVAIAYLYDKQDAVEIILSPMFVDAYGIDVIKVDGRPVTEVELEYKGYTGHQYIVREHECNYYYNRNAEINDIYKDIESRLGFTHIMNGAASYLWRDDKSDHQLGDYIINNEKIIKMASDVSALKYDDDKNIEQASFYLYTIPTEVLPLDSEGNKNYEIGESPVADYKIKVDRVKVNFVEEQPKTTTSSGGGSRTQTVEIQPEEVALGITEFDQPYIVGFEDITFRPELALTRAQLATIFARILKLDITDDEYVAYTDLHDEQGNELWSFKYVQAISKIGIFEGYPDGSFKPNKAISRAEIAKVFSTYWEYKEVTIDETPSPFVDISDHWAEVHIHRMYNGKVTGGFADGTYRPDEMTKREQIVMMVNQILGRPEINRAEATFTDVNDEHWAYGNVEAAVSTQEALIQEEMTDEKEVVSAE